jgi:hypothetical protein
MTHVPISVDLKTPSPLKRSYTVFLRAAQAGLAIAHAPRWQVWINGIFAIILIAMVVVATVLWQHSRGIAYILASPTDAIQEAWARAYANSGEEFVIFLPPLVCTLFVLLSAWTHLIDAHRTGSSLSSFALTVRVASASLWPALLLIAAGCAICMAIDAITRGNRAILNFFGDPPWGFVLIVGIPASGLVLAAWTRRALSAAARPAIEIHVPHICEGCGYDLTHRPADGLCPECGRSVASSLEPLVQRPGSAWEHRVSLGAWLKTMAESVVRPRSFYGRLQLRTPIEAVGRFANLQLLAIGIGVAVWLLAVFIKLRSMDRGVPRQIYFFPFAFGLMIPFVGWGLHRLLTALVFSHWIWQKAMPDFAWARKVFYYESAYLWVFCLFNGSFLTSVLLNGFWLSGLTKQVLGHQVFVLGLPLEPFTVLAGNFILCAIWIWRYYIALAAIRWSNF